jgi:hypothetical protein
MGNLGRGNGPMSMKQGTNRQTVEERGRGSTNGIGGRGGGEVTEKQLKSKACIESHGVKAIRRSDG